MLRKTQKTTYWQELTIDDSDQAFLDDLFLEKECPLLLDELALSIIQHRCKTEETAIRRKLTRGEIYQPKEKYAIGDSLVFPALDYALGKVVGTRLGSNPEHGDFDVIQVVVEPNDKHLEFASGLTAPHALNFEGGVDALLWHKDMLTPEELFELYGPGVRQKLVDRFNSSDDMVQFGNLWFNKTMMATIHVGHLNIAEAMLDINNQPLSTRELLKELDLPGEIPLAVQTFSLNYALANDERFIDAGSTDNILWYLTRLVPPEIIYSPRRLYYSPISYERSVLNEELLQLERELDDEASDLIAPPGADGSKSIIFVLNYPHRRVGTLPLTAKTRRFFPSGTTQYTQIVLVDARTGKEMPGWVNHQERYVYGLEQWYQDNRIPVGAFIELGQTKDKFKTTIGFKSRRMKREWVRVAEAVEDNLNFVVRKMPIACEYDETMLVWAEDSSDVDALWTKVEETNKSLSEIIRDAFVELAKLNPQGSVHAKTVYSAVNIVRRCPPAPIFAELKNNPAFVSVEGARWKYVE